MSAGVAEVLKHLDNTDLNRVSLHGRSLLNVCFVAGRAAEPSGCVPGPHGCSSS